MIKLIGVQNEGFAVQELKLLPEVNITSQIYTICPQYNPIRPGLFSRWSGQRGSEARMPKIKVTDHSIETKLRRSYDSYKSMPDARFEFGSLVIFGDMTSQNLSLKKETSHRIRLFTPGKWVSFLKSEFYMCRIILLDPKLTPYVNFSNFQAKEIFSFPKFLRRLDEKRAAPTPD